MTDLIPIVQQNGVFLPFLISDTKQEHIILSTPTQSSPSIDTFADPEPELTHSFPSLKLKT